MNMRKIEIYDTTLRDGSQSEDVNFSVEDKLRITGKLDELGIHYVEGGWPGSNPRDAEYFKKAARLRLSKTVVVAFGSTHRPRQKVQDDQNIRHLIESKAGVVTIFGKTWDFHVREALRISLDANLGLIYDSISHLKKYVERVFFDAEHFFNGYKDNPGFALKCLLAAQDAGADCIIPCDTNGGTLPHEVERIFKELLIPNSKLRTPIGIHAHNDSECAVANSLIAVEAGAVQVQGTINGLGERCGNANLCSIIPNLQIKQGYRCLSDKNLKGLREVSRFVNELANIRHFKRQPFVGDSAFAHKGGIHVSAVQRRPETYEHIRPEFVGNAHRILISDLAGRSNILQKAQELHIPLKEDSPEIKAILDEIKDLEHQGFEFEAADASFELLIRRKLGLHKKRRFDSESIWYKVLVDKEETKKEPISVAILMVNIKGRPETVSATGVGPVHAMDKALRAALRHWYPAIYTKIKAVKLMDYKVRVLTAGVGTSAKVRVLVESGDKDQKWNTVGVSENIIEASWQALVDSIEYKLLKAES